MPCPHHDIKIVQRSSRQSAVAAAENTSCYTTFQETATTTGGFDAVFSANDCYPGIFLKDENGNVTYGTDSAATRATLKRLADWYQKGYIDQEMDTRDSTIELINSGKVGMFFGAWWVSSYGIGDAYRNDPTANWQAYPIFTDDNKYYVKAGPATTGYCVINKNASADVAKAVIIMANVLLRDESKFDVSEQPLNFWPVRMLMAPADECEYTYHELINVLDGKTSPEDYQGISSAYKLLANDVSVVKDVVPGYESGKQLSIEDFSMENFGNFQRMYSLLIGDRPYATTTVDKKSRSCVFSQTPTMESKWSNLLSMEKEMVMKVITGKSVNVIVPLAFALLLNEIREMKFKKIVQTVAYLPHFLSWVILASIFLELFSFQGAFNTIVSAFGVEPKIWFAEEKYFRQLVIFSDVWKEFGYNAVIYLAALTGVSQDLYEAAATDGCSRLKAVWHITLPGIAPTIVVVAVLGLGNVLNAGFDQVFNLYSPLVYSTGDILDNTAIWIHRNSCRNRRLHLRWGLLPVVQAAGGAACGSARHPGGAKRRCRPSGNALLSAGTEGGKLFPAELHLPSQKQNCGGDQGFMRGYQEADGIGVDPWKEFGSIGLTDVHPHFVTGLIRGYFGGEPPLQFWKLLLSGCGRGDYGALGILFAEG